MKLAATIISVAVVSLVLTVVIYVVYIIHLDRTRKMQSVSEYLKQPGLMLTAPFNRYIEKKSSDSTEPFIDLSVSRKSLYQDIRKYWAHIAAEGEMLTSEMTPIKGDLFFTHIVKDDLWKKSYIKWYCITVPAILKKLPGTVISIPR